MEQLFLPSLDALASRLSGKKTLLVCGSSFDRLPLGDSLKGLELVRFSDFSPNPRYEDVCKGVERFRLENCQAILAIGGGSAMDTAKCIKLFAAMDPSLPYLDQPYPDSPTLLAAVPTTAGTGSESTHHAVIYFQGQKQSISHLGILPDYVCLIPELLLGLSKYQKACTMLDALCQALESWWSVHSTQESAAFSREAMTLIRDNWRSYVEDNNRNAAEKILLAANLSGRAIHITATTAPHAMSYKLTSLYGLPHGHAVALCCREVWQYTREHPERCVDPRGEEHLKDVFAQFPADLPWFCNLLEDLELSRPCPENRWEELEILTASVNPLRLKNHPVFLSEETLRSLYERILL